MSETSEPPKPAESSSPMAAVIPLAGLPRQILYQSAFALLSRPLQGISAHEGLLLVSELRPRPEDYARVFAPAYVELARRAYDALFLAARPLERSPQQTVLRLSMATAAELSEYGVETCEFPGGYREILGALLPESLWVHWKYVAPGSSSGMAYDGLTRLDDRWVWFPKPYRVLPLAAAAEAQATAQAPSPAPTQAPSPSPTQATAPTTAPAPNPTAPSSPDGEAGSAGTTAPSESAAASSTSAPPKVTEMWKE